MATTQHLNEINGRHANIELRSDLPASPEVEHLKKEIQLQLIRQDRME